MVWTVGSRARRLGAARPTTTSTTSGPVGGEVIGRNIGQDERLCSNWFWLGNGWAGSVDGG